MKRVVIYILLLAAALLIPVDKVDVAKLRPIEVIYISKDGDTVLLQTDTDDVGLGADAAAALENMEQTSPAVIYLDTARYLLIGPGGEEPAQQLRGILKNGIRLCAVAEPVALTDVAQYLPVHGDLPKFTQWEAGEQLPILRLENDRIKIS